MALSLCLLSLVRQASEGTRWNAAARTGAQCLGLLASGFGLYYMLWTMVCGSVGVERQRAEDSLSGLGGLFTRVWEAGGQYFDFLLRAAGVLGPLLPAVHVSLLAVLCWKLAVLFRERRLPRGNRRFLCLCVLLLPPAFCSASILIPDDAHALTAFAREFLYLLAVMAMEPPPARAKAAPKAKDAEKTKGADADAEADKSRAFRCRTILAGLLCLALWHHIVFANQVYMKKDLEKNATLVLAGRILDRIESVEGYIPGQTPVIFAGRLDANALLDQPREAFADLSAYSGLWHSYAATYNLGRYLTDYLRYPFLWDQELHYTDREEVREMPAFPAMDCVRIVDGTVVVKLS